jgi:hypothetical protein
MGPMASSGVRRPASLKPADAFYLRRLSHLIWMMLARDERFGAFADLHSLT